MRKYVVRISGGLGNQLFQYCFAKYLEEKLHEKIVLDCSNYLRDKNRQFVLGNFLDEYLAINVAQEWLYYIRYILSRRYGFDCLNYVSDDSFVFDEDIYKKGYYFAGYWQNIKYFDSLKCELKKSLQYKKKLTSSQKSMIEKMRDSESVAVHVRRGDYLSSQYNDIYELVDERYYKRAVESLENRIDNIVLFLFSDDVKWCKQAFKNYNGVYINEISGGDDIIEFELMRNCKHFIIANSTYSWWASYLGADEKSIKIAPSRWMKNENEYLNQRIHSALLEEYELL